MAEIKKCSLCLIERVHSGYEIPGISFTALEEEPWVCEQCAARIFGIDLPWKQEIQNNFSQEFKN